MAVHVFGIRHHGPGCARSLVKALVELAPDVVLVEGPPEADGIVADVDDTVVPPVAILVHAPERPGEAVFYPFAVYSPEWQALQYALRTKVPFRFIDLPQSFRMVEGYGEDEADRRDRDDPLGMLSEAAGLADRELWWEQEIEARRDATGLFEGILEAMAALREGASLSVHEARREAYMRQCIRAAQKEGFQRIAVVCGAWHAPMLATLGPAKPDQELLKGLAKIKVAATWIPWTSERLATRSGYGAGVESPGWYAHLWDHRGQVAVRWATRAARLLRGEDLDASSASVIETVRLAEGLAALRELAMPGLDELREATLAVLCHGEATPLALVHDRLEIGHELGQVPPRLVHAPLQRELEAEQRRLRLKVSVERQLLELDLRKDNDRERSRLFRRLELLGIDWATPAASMSTGTFREAWTLAWEPEMVVALISASVHGNTLAEAAAAVVEKDAQRATLAQLTELIDKAVLAELRIDGLLAVLEAKVSQSAEVRGLLSAMPPLVRVLRYGDVRGTRAESVRPALHGLFERALVGLPAAAVQIDDEAAAQLATAIGEAHAAIVLLDEPDRLNGWLDGLSALSVRDAVHPRLRGQACRLLLERQRLDGESLGQRASLAMSTAVSPAAAAGWIEGLVAGPALALLHQDLVWQVLDGWLAGISAEAFVQVLPLLRRAFAGFAPAERREMGARLKRGAVRRHVALAIDEARAARVLPILKVVLG